MSLIQHLLTLFVLVLAFSASGILAGDHVYNVVDFGAIGDGNANDTQAFVNTWNEACYNSKGPASFRIPARKTFLLGNIVFRGPCNYYIRVEVDGNLKRINEIWPAGYTSWILFIRINQLSIIGTGEIDGQGTDWWSCRMKQQCPFRTPHSLQLLGCNKAVIWGLRLKNSPMMQLVIGDSVGVKISRVTITAPDESPNTDGIHVERSRKVNISDSVIGTGDDCVSMSNSTSEIYVNNVTCGPGHGISIGSLGIKGSRATATGIHVSNCVLSQTTNGVRIKTWQGGSGFARDISFVNITMNQVRNPIIIDQFYCPEGNCQNQTSAVKVSDVRFIGVTGSSTSEVSVSLKCSQNAPCTGIVMDGVNLWPAENGNQDKSYCFNVQGTKRKIYSPDIPCLTQV